MVCMNKISLLCHTQQTRHKGIQWDNILQAIVFSYNVSANVSSKYSRFQALCDQFPFVVSQSQNEFQNSYTPIFTTMFNIMVNNWKLSVKMSGKIL
jgi:hypothetical protein